MKYNNFGQILQKRVAGNDDLCYTVECKYDSFGQIIEEKVTDGAETVFRQNNYTYNYSNAAVADCAEVVTTSKLQGDDVRVVKNYTNAWGNAKKSTILVDGEEISVTNNYDGMGNLVSTVDGNGNTTSYSYDYDRKPVATTNAAGDTATVTYDALGLKSASTDFMGNITTYEYDDMNRLFRTIAPLTDSQSSKTENYYDADGNLATERVYTSASLYRDSKYTYDSRNRLETVTQDGVSYTKYFYDNLGNVRKMANGLTSADLTAPETALSDFVAVTSYTYHPYLNLAETVTNPDGTTHNYSYNYFGLLENESYTRDNSSYGEIGYLYDDFGQLLSQTADGKTESFAYDMLGRLTTKTDGTGITRYTYDTADRLVKEVADNGIVKNYGYDANGNRTSFKFYTGYGDIQQDLSYTYDRLNRVTNIKEGSSTIASYTYDKNSNLLTENNVVVKSNYTYNAGNLVTNKTTTNSAGTALQTDNYSYLCDGNVFTENDKSYTYDLRNRLSGVSETDEENKNYTFDSFGNRLTKTIGSDTISYTYDKNNRILSQTNSFGTTNYSYDDRGNLYLKTVSVTADTSNSELTAEAISISNTDSQMFEFDGFNRMSGMETGGISAEYEYDSSGLRTSKTVNGERTEFVLDGIYVIAEVNADGDVTNYIRGLTGIIYRETPNGTKTYYVTNNHGDVTKLVNSSGTTIKSYIYDEFGNELNIDSTDDNPFRYCGEYFDTESGLIYLRARYYDPSIGRFISEDPAMDDLNWYVYCGSNPIMNVDITGLADEWVENLTARMLLKSVAYKQYPWMLNVENKTIRSMINIRINTSILKVEINKSCVNDVSEHYGVPNEIIGGIIFKEQLTQSLPDCLANIDVIVRGKTHSTGLGAIFPSTARKAWNVVDPGKRLPTSDAELQYFLSSDNEFNIETIAVVLVYEAINKNLISNPNEASSLSIDEWKGVVAAYNGNDEYANKVYEYLPHIEELLD